MPTDETPAGVLDALEEIRRRQDAVVEARAALNVQLSAAADSVYATGSPRAIIRLLRRLYWLHPEINTAEILTAFGLPTRKLYLCYLVGPYEVPDQRCECGEPIRFRSRAELAHHCTEVNRKQGHPFTFLRLRCEGCEPRAQSRPGGKGALQAATALLWAELERRHPEPVGA